MAFLFSIIQSSAKTSSLSFEGLSIDGDIKSLVDELHNKGFSDYYFEEYYAYALQGMYEGQDCNILCMYTPLTNTAFSVTVLWPFKENWKSIKKDYQKLKKLISKEYGSPCQQTEGFSGTYKEGDKKELQAISSGNCLYKSVWELDNGSITLDINPHSINLNFKNPANAELFATELTRTNDNRQKWFNSEFNRRKALLDSCVNFEFPEYHTGDFPVTLKAGNDNGHEYVDLGLPSGTKWATCNYGAKLTTDYGSYRMWYGIKENPRYFEKSYCPSLYDIVNRGHAFRNGKLSASGDLITSKYGETWSTPSVSQFNELLNDQYCYWEKAKLDGVEGYMVFSKTNLNYIFFPAAGYNYNSQYYGKDYSGVYWTSNAETKHDHSAYALVYNLHNKDPFPKIISKASYDGCSIRPVTYRGIDNTELNQIINVNTQFFKFGSLQIDSDTIGEVYIDGMRFGTTPAEIDSLSIGVHILEIKADGYNPLKAEVNVNENECSQYSFNLIKADPIVQETIAADSIPAAPQKDLKPRIIEEYNKFENYYEARVPSQLSRDVYCCVYKTVKGKSVRYMMLWELLGYTCVHESPVKLILLFKDGTKKTFKVDMDTDVYEDPYSDRVCFSYTAAEFIPVSFVELLSNKELDAVKLYIFEKDITNELKKEQFMVDLKALIQAKPSKK